MKILVCGGRNYNDKDALFRALDNAHSKNPISIIIHGDQSGADKLSGEWGDDRGVLVARVAAQWTKRGRSAGPIRNRGMLSLCPDGVIAFPGGDGTADMIKIAEDKGIKCWKPYG